jgi:hypothetical protein
MHACVRSCARVGACVCLCVAVRACVCACASVCESPHCASEPTRQISACLRVCARAGREGFLVPTRMSPVRAQSRPRCERGEPIPGADVGSGSPVLLRLWAGGGAASVLEVGRPSPSGGGYGVMIGPFSRAGRAAATVSLPGAAVRGVSPVLLRMWIGPVPVKRQAALRPVMSKMWAWASPVLAQVRERTSPVPAQRWDGGEPSQSWRR